MINDAVRGYFGFERLPFDRSVPVGALFASASHQEAAGRIAYGIDTRQITVITGEVGAGKTVAARAATARLDASRHQLIAIPNPQVGARGIHHAVVAALGGVPRVHHATLIPQAAPAVTGIDYLQLLEDKRAAADGTAYSISYADLAPATADRADPREASGDQ